MFYVYVYWRYFVSILVVLVSFSNFWSWCVIGVIRFGFGALVCLFVGVIFACYGSFSLSLLELLMSFVCYGSFSLSKIQALFRNSLGIGGRSIRQYILCWYIVIDLKILDFVILVKLLFIISISYISFIRNGRYFYSYIEFLAVQYPILYNYIDV
jgi:hypothetical protein